MSVIQLCLYTSLRRVVKSTQAVGYYRIQSEVCSWKQHRYVTFLLSEQQGFLYSKHKLRQ